LSTASAWLLRLAELLLAISGQIGLLLYAVEILMLALAMIIVAYWLVSKLDYLRRFMPPEL
jgi:hypothetical protein